MRKELKEAGLRSENIFDYDLAGVAEQMYAGCTFCSQFVQKTDTHMVSVIFGDEFNRVLYEDDKFVVFPGLGHLVEGYLIIIPKVHVTCFANMPHDFRRPFLDLKERIRKILEAEYGAPAFFEHGSISEKQLGSASVNHAHMHAVPIKGGPDEFLPQDIERERIGCFEDIWYTEIRGPYIFFESSDREAAMVHLPKDYVSQFVRRRLAEKVGMSDRWNWREYMCVDKFIKTLSRLSGTFDKS